MQAFLDAIAGADHRAYERLVAARPAELERAIALTANAGRGGLIWITLAAALRTRTSSLPLMRCAATTLAVYTGSLALARVVRRPRPFEGRDVRVLVERPKGPSLPSDQVAAAFAATPFLAAALPAAGPAFYAAAAALGGCRVLAGVHYPGDVLAAALLGTTAGIAARRI